MELRGIPFKANHQRPGNLAFIYYCKYFVT